MALRAATESAAGQPGQPSGSLHLTPEAERAVKMAAAELQQVVDQSSWTGYMLAALLRQETSIAVKALESLGVNRAAAERQTSEAIRRRRQDLSVPPSPWVPDAWAAMWDELALAPTALIPTPAPPRLEALIRVLALRQTARRPEVDITALSLEEYGDGFLIVIRILALDSSLPGPAIPQLPLLRPTLSAHDDHGKSYVLFPRGGRGEGRALRYELTGTPALAPTARQVRIRVPAVSRPGGATMNGLGISRCLDDDRDRDAKVNTSGRRVGGTK